jgi:hypothetical protein
MKTITEKVLERLTKSDDRNTAEDLIDLLTQVNLKDLLRMCEIDQQKTPYTEAVVEENRLDIEALRRVIAMFEDNRKSG